MSSPRTRVLSVALAAAAWGILFALPLDMPSGARAALALSVTAALFWTLEPVPVEFTSLCLLAVLPASGVVTFEQAFAAFSGKAVWLVFSGMALSLLITETGIGERLTGWILGRIDRLDHLVATLHLVGLGAALLVPSGVVRVIIIMPMLVALLDAIGEPRGSRVSAAVILSAVCATYYGGTGILTASVPNLVVMGIMEGRGEGVYWSQWAFYVLPVIGILRVALSWGVIRLVFGVRGDTRLTAPPAASEPVHLGARERRSGLILLVGVLLWATDIVHGVHPAFVGLGLVLLAFLPGWGPLPVAALRKVNFPVLIYIGALFAVGEALGATGVSDRLAAALPGALPLGGTSPLVQLGGIASLVTPFNFLADTAVVAGALTPVMLDFGVAAGLGALPVGLSVAVGAGMVFLPYQGAPFMVAYSFGRVRMGQFALVMILVALLGILLLIPLNLAYWRLVGLV